MRKTLKLILLAIISISLSCNHKKENPTTTNNKIIANKKLNKVNFIKKNFYNEDGNWLEKTIEYIDLNNNLEINQIWFFDKDGDTIFSKSKFYSIILNDTIMTNEVLKGGIYLEANFFKEQKSQIYTYLPVRGNENFNPEFSNESTIKIDTFYNLSNSTDRNKEIFRDFNLNYLSLFGKHYSTSGQKKLRGVIVEYYNDSLGKSIENKTYFEKEIYVKDAFTGNGSN